MGVIAEIRSIGRAKWYDGQKGRHKRCLEHGFPPWGVGPTILSHLQAAAGDLAKGFPPFLPRQALTLEGHAPGNRSLLWALHRLPRWLVGTAASLLGLSLLLVRWGLWASGSTVIEGA